MSLCCITTVTATDRNGLKDGRRTIAHSQSNRSGTSIQGSVVAVAVTYTDAGLFSYSVTIMPQLFVNSAVLLHL